MIVNGLIVGAAVMIAALAIWGVWLWLGRGEGRHTADALTSEDASEESEFHAAPLPSLHDGFMAALAMNKRGEDAEIWADRNAGRFDSALDGPANGHSLSGEAGPSTLASPDPAAAVEPLPPRQTLPPPPALHHDAYRYPQRWHPAPAAAPTAGPPPDTPLHAVATAMGAVRGMPASEYLQQLQDATTWENRAPFTDWLSEDTMARGIPAIRDGGDWDAPLSIPPEVVHEMEAGV